MSEFANRANTLLNATPASAAAPPWVAAYHAVAGAAMQAAAPAWAAVRTGKRAAYFSAEFLLGRLVYSNLLNLGLLDEATGVLQGAGLAAEALEAVPDAALGNGGLGRLAACFLDSGATLGHRLDGYGIRYQYGLFRQWFENGFQREAPDDWQRWGDPFSLRREAEKVPVAFGDGVVWAVPYDMPVIGWQGKTVNTLRLWQAEAMDGLDFDAFNRQRYGKAYRAANSAAALHGLLYPADDTDEGKALRLKQQYFFTSASLQSLLADFERQHGQENYAALPQALAVQLNDTHPTVAIPELLRLLVGEKGLEFDDAFNIGQAVFAYTNHTIMPEALEQWDTQLFARVLPGVWPYVVMLQHHLRRALSARAGRPAPMQQYNIVQSGRVHMARMAIYASHSTNGVAQIHTDILKSRALAEWHAVYPERFNNKTNGVTPRRWIKLCNPALAALLDEVAGPEWVTQLDQLAALRPLAGDAALRQRFAGVKAENKRRLAAHVQAVTGHVLDENSLFDIQIKRLHEYKRQLLNAFSLLDWYYSIKEGEDLPPVTCLFGAKAAAGYFRAKGIIKYINEIARLVDGDPAMRGRLKVLFVPDYNVSWAEKLIPAADVSQQISTAGTEASGTGNMKLAMNGAVTLGTWDGANIEIVQAAGEENNYIFGARVEELDALRPSYDAMAVYRQNPRLRRVVDSLVDGTVDDGGTGMFRELHTALLRGASWHAPDHYFVLHDFDSYVAARKRAARDYTDAGAFAGKCLCNIAASGPFSSDRTIAQYAEEIWGLSR